MVLLQYRRDEVVEYLEELDDSLFAAAGLSKEAVLTDSNTVDQLWGLYQKDVEEYDIQPDEAFANAMQEVLHMSLDK